MTTRVIGRHIAAWSLAAGLVAGGCTRWEWRERALGGAFGPATSMSVAGAARSAPALPARTAPPGEDDQLGEWLREIVESHAPMRATVERVEDEEGRFTLRGRREDSPLTLAFRDASGALFRTRRGERAPAWSESLEGERLFFVSRRASTPEERLHERGPLGFVTYMILARPTSEGAPRGTAIYCTGMLGLTREEFRLVEALRGAGWMTLVIQPPWGVFDAGKAVIGERSIELGRFEGDTRAAGELLATIADDGFREWTLAARAALAHAARVWDDAPPRPRVVVASSLGAIATPGLARGLRDSAAEPAFDAAVLIGGGGDLLTVARRSGIFRGPRAVKAKSTSWESWDHASAMDEIVRAYREASTLDPLAAASELRATPTLVVQATLDDIVPTSTGEALWRALETPSRLNIAAGHILMFTLLPGDRFARIVEWIDEQAPREADD